MSAPLADVLDLAVENAVRANFMHLGNAAVEVLLASCITGAPLSRTVHNVEAKRASMLRLRLANTPDNS
jgi:hypothetical protein